MSSVAATTPGSRSIEVLTEIRGRSVVVVRLDGCLACLHALIITDVVSSDSSRDPYAQRRHVNFHVVVVRLLVRATCLTTCPVSSDAEEKAGSGERYDQRNDPGFVTHALLPPGLLRFMRLRLARSGPHSVHSEYAAGSVLSEVIDEVSKTGQIKVVLMQPNDK
jgi:hypothetical protein